MYYEEKGWRARIGIISPPLISFSADDPRLYPQGIVTISQGLFPPIQQVGKEHLERAYGMMEEIINISSGTAFRGGDGKNIHYVTSKAAVLGFTRTLARELGDYGITVNTLAPGGTQTEGKKEDKWLPKKEHIPATRCLKRVEVPEDLIGPMVFLCSGASDFMTGQTMIVDGGNMMI